MNIIEYRARYECVVQYRTYLNLSGLAQTYFDNGEYGIGRTLSEQAYQHRQFARNCVWIVTGKYYGTM